MTKILKSTGITPFGGLNFVLEEFNNLKINNLFCELLPSLPNQSKYDWKDLILSLWSVFFCGGDCTEDLDKNLKHALDRNPYIKCPSPDRVLSRLKELAQPVENYQKKRCTMNHRISYHHELSLFNIKMLKAANLLSSDDLTLDYDNTLIYHKKEDADYTYKKIPGYFPGVGLIGNNMVYVENRSGNSEAAVSQEETLERMFSLLEKEGITVRSFRADSASCIYAVLAMVCKHVTDFYVRQGMNPLVFEAINRIDNWKEVIIDGETHYRGETDFIPFEYTINKYKLPPVSKACRIVVTKALNRSGKMNMITNEACDYSAIITNNQDKTADEVVIFYNQRGTAEREFDVLKNDFGWDKMPFSKLEQNTVFLILMGMCRNFYNHIIRTFSLKFRNLHPSYRIKKFTFRIICIAAKWVKTSRTYKLKIYGDLDFKT